MSGWLPKSAGRDVPPAPAWNQNGKTGPGRTEKGTTAGRRGELRSPQQSRSSLRVLRAVLFPRPGHDEKRRGEKAAKRWTSLNAAAGFTPLPFPSHISSSLRFGQPVSSSTAERGKGVVDYAREGKAMRDWWQIVLHGRKSEHYSIQSTALNSIIALHNKCIYEGMGHLSSSIPHFRKIRRTRRQAVKKR